MSESIKISYCISIKNRLHHLKETLPRHLEKMSGQKSEIVILDYGSTDGLNLYIKEKYFHEIKEGKITYFRMESGKYFLRSHARNVAFRLAKGEVLCNLDADNYFEGDFSLYIREHFTNKPLSFLWACDKKYEKDVYGRLCFKKDDFLALNGFNEEINTYGYEDIEFCKRLENLDREPCVIEKAELLKFIPHEEGERLKYDQLLSELKKVYVSYEGQNRTRFILFLKEQKCLYRTLLKGKSRDLSDNNWSQGKYTETETQIKITNTQLSEVIELIKKENQLIHTTLGSTYKEILKDSTLYKMLSNKLGQLQNTLVMYTSIREKKIKVNEKGFGKGQVIKNFDVTNPINLN